MHDARLEEFSYDECLRALRGNVVGRIGVVMNEFPVVLPVNYRLVETTGLTWIAVRTRPGNVIEGASMNVAFEIDGIDALHRQGWSVLVRGTLHHVDPDAADFRDRFDSEPWLTAERDAWLIIQPITISGRQLRAAEPDWVLHLCGYL
jgi:nitroimidazol reductase NimA-like FMN-containing flavoprotein (pyridoxamine 5'-phosphate oxidase superfamily)